MASIAALARTFLRRYVTDGVPSSGPNKPSKGEGIAVFDEIVVQFAAIQQGQAGGGLTYTTLAQLTADATDRTQYQRAEVRADPTPANNGVYQNTSATGTNTWVRISDLSVDDILGTNSTPLA